MWALSYSKNPALDLATLLSCAVAFCASVGVSIHSSFKPSSQGSTPERATATPPRFVFFATPRASSKLKSNSAFVFPSLG